MLEETLKNTTHEIRKAEVALWEESRKIQELAYVSRVSASELAKRSHSRKRRAEEDLEKGQVKKSSPQNRPLKKVPQDSEKFRISKDLSKEKKPAEEAPVEILDSTPKISAIDRALARNQAKYGVPTSSDKEEKKTGEAKGKEATKRAAKTPPRRVREIDFFAPCDTESEKSDEESSQKDLRKPLPDPAKIGELKEKEEKIRASQELEHSKRDEKVGKIPTKDQIVEALLKRKKEEDERNQKLLSASFEDENSVQELLQTLGLTQGLEHLESVGEN